MINYKTHLKWFNYVNIALTVHNILNTFFPETNPGNHLLPPSFTKRKVTMSVHLSLEGK